MMETQQVSDDWNLDSAMTQLIAAEVLVATFYGKA